MLEVRFVTGYGVLVKGGGPTVKNVTGYDLPRLFVGSFGTVGVLMQATLRCRPRPRVSQWFSVRDAAKTFHRPAARLWDGAHDYVLLEGSAADVAAQSEACAPVARPVLPDGAHRGRISVAPVRVHEVGRALDGDVRWCAEVGVGSVHVATDDADAFSRARRRARVRRLDVARGGRAARRRRLRTAAPEPRADAADQVGVRSRRSLQSGTLATVTGPLHLDDEALVACVSCGLCLPHCPTYRVTGREIASPRGRITAMRAVEWDAAPIDEAFRAAMEECVACRGCEAACPSGVPFGRLMEETRAALPAPPSAPRRVAEWLAYSLVLPRHWLLLAATWLLWFAQRIRLVPERFGLPRLSVRSLRRWELPAGGAPEAWLFTGCVMDAWMRDTHRAAARVMHHAGARAARPGAGADCCGALHVHAGREQQARALARRVIASMPGDAPVVVDSAGCGTMMKEYGVLLDTDDARRFSARVHDFAEWCLAAGGVPMIARGTRVVVQDPCHLRHVQKAHLAVRTLLGHAYTLAEPDDDGLCCGAGGAYSALQPALSAQIRERKVAALERAMGEQTAIVASANPGCIMQLRGAGIDARHPAELVAEAIDGRPIRIDH